MLVPAAGADASGRTCSPRWIRATRCGSSKPIARERTAATEVGPAPPAMERKEAMFCAPRGGAGAFCGPFFIEILCISKMLLDFSELSVISVGFFWKCFGFSMNVV